MVQKTVTVTPHVVPRGVVALSFRRGRGARGNGCCADGHRRFTRQRRPDDPPQLGFLRAFAYLPYPATANAERGFCIAISESINDLEELNSCTE